jgi:hypothetical protein
MISRNYLQTNRVGGFHMPAIDKKETKVLILSVSAQAGHVRAAQAIEAAIGRWYEDINPIHMDLMELHHLRMSCNGASDDSYITHSRPGKTECQFPS